MLASSFPKMRARAASYAACLSFNVFEASIVDALWAKDGDPTLPGRRRMRTACCCITAAGAYEVDEEVKTIEGIGALVSLEAGESACHAG